MINFTDSGVAFWDDNVYLMFFKPNNLIGDWGFYIAYKETDGIKVYTSSPEVANLLHKTIVKILKDESVIVESVSWLNFDRGFHLILSPNILINQLPGITSISNREFSKRKRYFNIHLKNLVAAFAENYKEESALRYFLRNRSERATYYIEFFVRTEYVSNYTRMVPNENSEFKNLLWKFVEQTDTYSRATDQFISPLIPGILICSTYWDLAKASAEDLRTLGPATYVSVNPEFILDLPTIQPTLQDKIRMQLEQKLLEGF